MYTSVAYCRILVNNLVILSIYSWTFDVITLIPYIMSFYDFLVRFWWLEVVMLVGIIVAAWQDWIAPGTAALAGAVSFIIFLMLSRSGLE